MVTKTSFYFLLLIFLYNLCYSLFEDNFSSLDLDRWVVEMGSSTLSYRIVFDSHCVDNYCLELSLPANYNLSGPSRGINLRSRKKYRYGRYRVRMRCAYGGRDAGVVSAFFTYFNDYWMNPNNFTDLNQNGISDNSEIDIELLSKEPTVIYMTVWTDYDEVGGNSRFRKVTRKVNLSTGEIYQTPNGKENTYNLEKLQERLGFTVLDFDHTKNFYEYSFEWSSTSIRFYILIDNEEYLLWDMNRTDMIPRNEAYIMANMWHNSVHWDTGQTALPPSVDCKMRIDKISFLEIKEDKISDGKDYIFYLNKGPNINFGKVREVKIFDIKGTLIRTLIDPMSIYNIYDRSKYSEKIWDGKDKNGKVVKSGIYLYQIEDEISVCGCILIVK